MVVRPVTQFRRVETAVAGTDGTATITIVVPGGVAWLIGPSTVTTNGDGQPEADYYIGGTNQEHRVAGTYSGNKDTDPDHHPVAQSEVITCIWTGADPGDRCTFRTLVTQTELY